MEAESRMGLFQSLEEGSEEMSAKGYKIGIKQRDRFNITQYGNYS